MKNRRSGSGDGRGRFVVFVLIPAAGALLVLAATARFGCALTPDSGVYIAAACNLRGGNGLVSFDAEPYVTGPPLYPLILAAAPGVEAHPPSLLRILNAAAFGLFLALSAGVLARVLARPPSPGSLGLSAAAGAAGLLLCKPLLEVFSSAWSEIVFLPAVAGFLLLAQVIEDEGLTRARLWSFALVAATASLARYLGVALILTGLVVLLRAARNRAALPALALFGAVSSLPLALWLMRNRALSGTFTGVRGASGFSIGDILGGFTETLIAWAGLTRLAFLPAAALVAFVLAGSLLLLARSTALRSRTVPCAIFLGVYSALLTGLSLASGFDRVDARLLSPALLPLLAIVLAAGRTAASGPGRALLRPGLAVIALVWLVWSGARTSLFVRDARAHGAGGFATEAWQASPLAGFIAGLPSTSGLPPAPPILSNEPAAVYLLTGRAAALSPRRTLYQSDTAAGFDLAHLEWLVETRGAVRLAWFDSLAAPHVLTPEALGEELARRGAPPIILERTASVPDGSLFELSRVRGSQP